MTSPPPESSFLKRAWGGALKQLISPVNMLFYSDVRIWLEGAAVATPLLHENMISDRFDCPVYVLRSLFQKGFPQYQPHSEAMTSSSASEGARGLPQMKPCM